MVNDDLEVLYEPVLMTPDDEGIRYQAGAFRREEDAQAVLDLWRAERRSEEMAINAVPVFESFAQWRSER